MITFFNPEHCLRFIDCSSLIICRGNVLFTTHPASGELTYLTVYDAPYELLILRLSSVLHPFVEFTLAVLASCRNILMSTMVSDTIEFPWKSLSHVIWALGAFKWGSTTQIRPRRVTNLELARILRDCTNDVYFNCDGIGQVLPWERQMLYL